MDNELQNTDNTVSISKEKLKDLLLLVQEKERENNELKQMVNASVEIIDFVKTNFLGGMNPKDLTITKMIGIVGKMPLRLGKLTAEQSKSFSKNFTIVQTSAQKYLDESQIKKISARNDTD